MSTTMRLVSMTDVKRINGAKMAMVIALAVSAALIIITSLVTISLMPPPGVTP